MTVLSIVAAPKNVAAEESIRFREAAKSVLNVSVGSESVKVTRYVDNYVTDTKAAIRDLRYNRKSLPVATVRIFPVSV